MKLPVKNIKTTTTVPNVINPAFRKEFLDDIPNKGGSKVRGLDIALINDALRAIAEGSAKINGKTPVTRLERFIVISSYFKTVRTKFNMSFDGSINIKHTAKVSLKYNGQEYSHSFPESNVEN